MSRKKKQKEINIKSNETKIFFGLIIFVLGLVVFFSPFFVEQSKLFDVISLKLGYSAIGWGILLIYCSLFLLLKRKKIISGKQALGFFLFSLSLAVLLSFWLAPEQINNHESLKGAGGELGKILHQSLNGVFGSFIEILIVILMLVIAFSLITGTTLEQIRDFVENKIPEENTKEDNGFNLRDFFKKIGLGKKDGDIEISGGDMQITEPYVEQADEEEQERRLEEILHRDTTQNQEQYNKDDGFDITTNIQQTQKGEDEPQKPKFTNWIFPSVDILQEKEHQKQDERIYKEKARIIEVTLRNFGIQSKVVAIAVGPTVLRFSLSISTGTKVSRVKNLSNDLALALASQTASIRIEAPIPGTSFIGVEIPNPTPNFVYTKDMIKKLRQEMKQDPDKYELPLILGKDITGKTIIKDLAKIPHLLVA